MVKLVTKIYNRLVSSTGRYSYGVANATSQRTFCLQTKSKSCSKQIYDDIVFDYAATKSNPFKAKHEEGAFWKVIGDVADKEVLDLGCGSGYYTRKFREKGAAIAEGVDISENMIIEARDIEIANRQGVTYFVGDASTFLSNRKFDLVTSQYLLNYAESRAELQKMCETIYKNLKKGGRAVTMTTALDSSYNYENEDMGFSFVCYADNQVVKAEYWEDGVEVKTTLYSSDRQSKCSFPNFMWCPSTICGLMSSCGFHAVEYSDIVPGCPIVIITAIKY